ncbi:C45 family autoproteolytic acyltransferase/hydolase [Labrys wisconsinensis]|uniref:Peptidase C45 hydrolase domain-containing protein n=1 Tax=Labrys wisconsinensis TaxID=425677 RepID=A0ABU0JM22_9HYPH|nr:C45 family peptidase [Labrys wisconsinensis]MDQ0474299.1 hypothetical protein [Labrys wisconsinensis]
MSPYPAAFPFVSVSGTPFERGLRYGAAVPERIEASAALYRHQLGAIGYGPSEKTRLIDSFAAEIARFGEAYLEEMRGIAQGAGVSFADIVMINARTEVVARARLEQGLTAVEEDEPEEGCTGAIVLPERSRDGALIHAQNWDWRTECAGTGIVLRVQRDDGPDILTFVEAGGLARNGMNSAGVAITANYLESDRDYRQPGVPLALIRRRVLEQAHFALALRAVAATPKACSNNMMLSTAAGFAIDLECAPDEAFQILPTEGLIVHANHWVSPVALAKLRDTGLPRVPDSPYRDWRVRGILDAAGARLTADDVKRALFDDFLTPHAVCRPPATDAGANPSSTVAMVVMQPAAGIMDVCCLPAVNRGFTRYGFAGEPVRLAA